MSAASASKVEGTRRRREGVSDGVAKRKNQTTHSITLLQGTQTMAGRSTNIKFTVNAAFFREIKEDHHQLRCMLDKLRSMTISHLALANHLKEFSEHTAELRDQLAFHFTLEEAYGYFEDAIERAPRFHDQAGRLRAQHPELYVMASQLAEQSAVASTSPIDLEQNAAQLAEMFLAFDTALKAHEAAELHLILDAMQLDIGDGD